jgi:CheY-like chemotaxis protein
MPETCRVLLGVKARGRCCTLSIPMPATLSILLIEDHEDAREAMRALLELDGHAVETAAEGVQGIELARQKSPDVALIDIGLPGMDGYEVARRIRAVVARPPFLVALTGYGQPEDRQQATEAGFDAHLVKPVDPPELTRVLASIPRR